MQRFGYPQPDYTPDGVLAEIAQAVPFMRGVSWEGLGSHGKQWPILEDGFGTPVLHVDHFTRGLGRFHFHPWRESAEITTHAERFPFILTTGRLLEQYNCGTMTRRSGNNLMVSEDLLSIHPEDARRKHVRSGDRVVVRSARGEVVLTARVTDEVKPGVLHTTFHFPEALVNHLLGEGHDAETQCPEYKVTAVDVERAEVKGFLVPQCKD
jgi:formate dehydrogenase major subunit